MGVAFNVTSASPLELTRVCALVGASPTGFAFSADVTWAALELYSYSTATRFPVAAQAGPTATASGVNTGTRYSDPLPKGTQGSATSPITLCWTLPPGWWPAQQPGSVFALVMRAGIAAAAGVFDPSMAAVPGGSPAGLGAAGGSLLTAIAYGNGFPRTSPETAGAAWHQSSTPFTTPDAQLPGMLISAGPPSPASATAASPVPPALDFFSAAGRRPTAATSAATVVGFGTAVLFSTDAGDAVVPVTSVTLALNFTAPRPSGAPNTVTLTLALHTIRNDSSIAGAGAIYPGTPVLAAPPVSYTVYMRPNATGVPQRIVIGIPPGAWAPLPPRSTFALVLTSSDTTARVAWVTAGSAASPPPNRSSTAPFTVVAASRRLVGAPAGSLPDASSPDGRLSWSRADTATLPTVQLGAGVTMRSLADTTAFTTALPRVLPNSTALLTLPLGPDLSLPAALADVDGQPAPDGVFRGVGAVALVFKAPSTPVALETVTAVLLPSSPGFYMLTLTMYAADYWSRAPATDALSTPVGAPVRRLIRVEGTQAGKPFPVTFQLDPVVQWPPLQTSTVALALSCNDTGGAGMNWMLADDSMAAAGASWFRDARPLGVALQTQQGSYAPLPSPAGVRVSGAPILPAIMMSAVPLPSSSWLLADSTAGGALAGLAGVPVGPASLSAAAALVFTVDAPTPLAIESVSIPMALSASSLPVSVSLSLYTASPASGLPLTAMPLAQTILGYVGTSVDARPAVGGIATYKAGTTATFLIPSPRIGAWPLLQPNGTYAVVVAATEDSASFTGNVQAAADGGLSWRLGAAGAQNPGPVRLQTLVSQRGSKLLAHRGVG